MFSFLYLLFVIIKLRCRFDSDKSFPWQSVVEIVKQQAYKNQECIIEFDELPFFVPPRPLPEPLQPPIPDTGPGLQNLDSVSHQST